MPKSYWDILIKNNLLDFMINTDLNFEDINFIRIQDLLNPENPGDSAEPAIPQHSTGGGDNNGNSENKGETPNPNNETKQVNVKELGIKLNDMRMKWTLEHRMDDRVGISQFNVITPEEMKVIQDRLVGGFPRIYEVYNKTENNGSIQSYIYDKTAFINRGQLHPFEIPPSLFVVGHFNSGGVPLRP